MSVYDNKYWNHRIAELAEKVPATDDLSFFASEAYRDYTEQGVKDLICGTCTYLRTLGYNITEKQEKERIKGMTVDMSTDENVTAYTDGNSMVIGVNSSLVKYYPSRELRHYAIQGFRVHETAHVLFTDFKTANRWYGAFSNGNWWPKEPDHATDPDGAELTQILKKKEFSESFSHIAKQIENAIEDGFIEREIKEMYKGLATTELCTTNDAMISTAQTFGEILKAGGSAFSAMYQQILMYAKYDITMVDDMPEQYSDVFDACMEVVDDVKCERDSKKRLCGVNEICCIMYPLFKEMLVKNQEKKRSSNNGNSGKNGSGSPQNVQGQQDGSNRQNSDPNGNGSQDGSGGSQNSSNNGNGVGSMTTEQLSEALKEAAKQAEQAAKKLGVNNLPNRHSDSITNQADKNGKAKARESSKQNTSNNAQNNNKNNSIANTPGANSGKSDLSAAKCDIAAIEQERKRNVATTQANNEANNKLRQEGKEVGREIGTNIYVRRAAEVPQSNIETYNRLSAGLLSITKNLERRLKTTIRDEENDDTVAGLPMGSRVEARLAYHQDGKIFSRKNFPRDNPRLAVGYLCDESGSMSDTAIAASVRTAIILQDLCERMELPCYICGFTTEDSRGVDIITYVDMNVDGKDKYRTTGMASRGGTPTVPAMKYMGKKLMKDSTEKKILIVSTDGCSGRGYGETVRDVIKKLQHDGVMVIGAGIGDSKPKIQEEFGDNFLDISNLDAMPKILCNIVKKNLV